MHFFFKSMFTEGLLKIELNPNLIHAYVTFSVWLMSHWHECMIYMEVKVVPYACILSWDSTLGNLSGQSKDLDQYMSLRSKWNEDMTNHLVDLLCCHILNNCLFKRLLRDFVACFHSDLVLYVEAFFCVLFILGYKSFLGYKCHHSQCHLKC